MHLGTTEIILIIILALVLFGGSKLTGIGKALGTSIKDFKKAVKDDDKNADGANEDEDEAFGSTTSKDSKGAKNKAAKSASAKNGKAESGAKKPAKK